MKCLLKAAMMLAAGGGLLMSGAALAAFPAPYCVKGFSGEVDPITLVKIDGINNATPNPIGGVANEDFTAIVGALAPGGVYPISVKANTTGNYTTVVAVYIDWNQDGTFDAGEGYLVGSVSNSTGLDSIVASSTIQVPASALPGPTRMRVVGQNAGTVALASAPACGTTGFGQAEDYTVNIDPAAPVPPSIAMAFSPKNGPVGATSALTITFGNTSANPSVLTADFVDTLPTGLILATPANASTTCPATLTAADGAGTIKLGSGGTIPAGGCTISATVTTTAPGVFVNAIAAGALATSQGDGNATSATYQATAPGYVNYRVGFEAPDYTLATINGQQGWYASVPADWLVSTANPAVGAQAVRGKWTAAGSGTSLLLTKDLPAGTTTYSIASAKIAITPSGTGATFDFAPQDPVAGSVVARVKFLKGAGNKIQVLAGNPLGYVDTGASWPASTYFDFKVIAHRTAGTAELCLNGASIWTGASLGPSIRNVAVIGTKGTGTQNNLFDMDEVVIDNSNIGTCSGVAPLVAPSVSKAFAPASVDTNVDSTATITLSNPNASAITLSADLLDTLPTGTTASSPATTCTGGTASITAGVLSLSTGAAIPANGSCTLSALVRSATAGTYTNTIAAGALQTNAGNNAAAATATLTVTTPLPVAPTLAKSFTPAVIEPGQQSTAKITLANANSSAATLTAPLVDQFPAGVSIVSASTNCGLVLSSGGGVLAPAANSVTLPAGIKIPANGSCDITVIVTSSTSGTYVNTLLAGALQTDLGNSPSDASATLTVNLLAPTIAKAFAPTSVVTNTSSTATITLTNPNATALTLSADLVDTLPTDLVVAGTATTTCVGTVSNTTTSITLASGATIPASGSCKITASMQSATVGSYTNTIAAGALQTNAGNNATAATATLAVTTPPFPAPFCNVTFPNGVEPISRVKISGIDNPSSAAKGGLAIENFLSVAGGAVSRNGVYPIAVEGNTDGSYTSKIRVYVDWNQNGVFDANEGYVLSDLVNSTGTDGKQSLGQVAVPADAVLGATRMRVIKRFNTVPDACNAGGYGQAEDYTLTVDNLPPPLPNASVTPVSLALTAQQNMSATGTVTVSNSGPGQLTFNVSRALADRDIVLAAAKRVTSEAVERHLNDAHKAGITPAPIAPSVIDLVRSTGGVPAASGILASDPACATSVYGMIFHDHDGAPDNAYGWNATAGTTARIVDKFTPLGYPGKFSTLCLSFATNAGLTSVPIRIVAYADDGVAGAPGTELGSVSASATNIASGLNASFQAFDISSMNLSIASGSVYFGVEWDATAVTGLYLAVDETSTTSAGGYQYTADSGWSPIVDTRANYKAMYIRALQSNAPPPGIGCDSPSNVPWLSASPTSGSIDGIGSKDVTVTANATGLALGTHEALLCISTNDAAHPRFEIPVSFTVTPNIADDTIFKDGFDGAQGNPNVVVGTVNLPVVQSSDGSSFDFTTGSLHPYSDTITTDDINLYTLAPPAINVYWYGDAVPGAFSTLVGGVVATAGGKDFKVLHSGDVIGPSSPVSAASQGADMSAFNAGVAGYIGIAFYNEVTSALNFGYLHVQTSAGGYPIQVLDYGYDKSGAAITIP